ncbi:uncharacterized protein LOC107226476 [Neodiprion lecontei]|uniref:Uncharacterized protein LOC107226476 n=1 Tax=Neodiprion lecontei TaxID=441921 RepID=A0A6J0C628_NEOLC|nr:uncharacterized protein LOC107226476 [Neodiprion lecontei]
MPVDLYYLPPSIPCRAVMMLAKALGIHLNLKVVNILEGEHLKPEFLKINPQHTIPTINDNGLILWESRVIMGYFVEKYAKNDSLYPKDPQRRGNVDQKLYFDLGTLNQNLLKTYFPIILGQAESVDDKNLEALEKAFEVLDTFLEMSRFVAGDQLTIADFSIVATVSTADAFGFDIGRFDNVANWYRLCQKALANFGYEEINTNGAKMLGDMLKKRKAEMTIDLYYVPGSAPCRAVLLTAAAVGVELNKKMTDLMKGEHLKPEFLKMNPQHTIPTLDDDGFYLWESRAIMGYLVDKYAKNDSLFPKDPKSRALINQRLYFDHGTLYNAFAEYFYPTIFGNAPADPVKREKIDQALEFLDKFLEGQKYAAGKTLTIADLALAVTVSNFEVMNLDLSKFKNVVRWLATIESEAPKYEETNGAGAKAFKELVDSLKK